MRAEEFEQLVAWAYKRIPSEFRRRLQNVALLVEQEPSREQLAKLEPGHTLLGLYEGRPLTERRVYDSFTMPDRITIFQGPLERLAGSEAELQQMVEDTVWHEVAHYFGLDEPEVRAAERRRAASRTKKPRTDTYGHT